MWQWNTVEHVHNSQKKLIIKMLFSWFLNIRQQRNASDCPSTMELHTCTRWPSFPQNGRDGTGSDRWWVNVEDWEGWECDEVKEGVWENECRDLNEREPPAWWTNSGKHLFVLPTRYLQLELSPSRSQLCLTDRLQPQTQNILQILERAEIH